MYQKYKTKIKLFGHFAASLLVITSSSHIYAAGFDMEKLPLSLF